MPQKENTVVHTALSRDMGLFSVTMIGVGAMIGAGIFVLTGIAAGISGPGLLFAFVLDGIISLITALAYAELGSSFPEAGGGYLWVKEALPDPNGFISGWISWFAHAVAASLYALGFAVYFLMLLKLLHINFGFTGMGHANKVIAAVVCVLLAYVNYRGAKETGRTGAVITIAKLIILAAFVAAGLYRIYSLGNWTADFTPFLPQGYSGVFQAMGITFIAFEGYEIIAQSGEEVKNPHKNIPRAILLSLFIVVPVYLLVGFVSIGAVHVPGMPSWVYLGKMKELAVLEAAKQFLPGGAVLILFGGLLSTLSALNATIYSSSRVAFAMGRDSNLPEIFNRISTKTSTPVYSILITTAIIITMCVTLPIEDVASASDIMFLLLFVFVNLALINLRRLKPDMERHFRMPLVPLLPMVGIASLVVVTLYLSFFKPLAWFTIAGWITVGLAAYYAYFARLEKATKVSRVAVANLAIERKDFSVLVSAKDTREAVPLAQMAELLAKARSGEIIAMNNVEIPEQLPLNAGLRFTEPRKKILEDIKSTLAGSDVPLHLLVRVSHRLAGAISDTIGEYDVKFVLLGWDGYVRSSVRTFGRNIDSILRTVPCDVALLKYSETSRERWPSKLFRRVARLFRRKAAEEQESTAWALKRIFLPVADGPNAKLAAELASGIARTSGAGITAVTVVQPGEDVQRAENLIHSVLQQVDLEKVQVDTRVVKSRSIGEVILNESKGHDLIVIGASRRSLYYQLRHGSLPKTVAFTSPMPVMIVKKYEGAVASWIRRFFVGG